MNECLILVDLQNDYFSGGAMELVDTDKAAANAQLLLEKFRGDGWPIVHVQHIAAHEGATFFLPDTTGAEINQIVAPLTDETVVVKNFPNSFRDTDLLDILQKTNIKKLVIGGAMSHMCIDATTRAAADLGFDCVVAEDACTTRDQTFNDRTIKSEDVHAAFMAALSAAYATVLPTAKII